MNATRTLPKTLSRRTALRLFLAVLTALMPAAPWVGVTSVQAQTSVPTLMNYQGRLTDTLNNPLAGNQSFLFEVYDAATGGLLLWNETQPAVPVTNGVFSAVLGSVTPLPSTVFAGGSAYLQITVNGTPLTPRQRLVTSPFAHSAQLLQGRDYAALVSTDTAQTIAGAKTFTGAVHVPTPTIGTHAVNKSYVDAQATGASGWTRTGAVVALSNATDAAVVQSTLTVYGSAVAVGGGGISAALRLRPDAAKSFTITSDDTATDIQTLSNTPLRLQNAGGGAITLGTNVTAQGIDATGFRVSGTGLNLSNDASQNYLKLAGNRPLVVDPQGVANNTFIIGTKTAIGSALTYLDQPVTTLDVAGDAQFGSGATKSTFTATGDLRVAGTLSAGAITGVVMKAGDNMTGQLTLANSTLTVQGNQFSVGGSTFAVNAGFVGIRIAAPDTALHINNPTGLKVQNGGDTIRLAHAAPTRFQFDGTYVKLGVIGRLGAGTSDPMAQLDVEGDAQFGAGANKSTFSATGALTFPAGYTPSSGQQAATKAYVDTAAGAFVRLAGDTMTGQLTVNGSSHTIVDPNIGAAGDAFSFAVTTAPARGVYHLAVSTNGRVGLGTAMPEARLHIVGSHLTDEGSDIRITNVDTPKTWRVGVGGLSGNYFQIDDMQFNQNRVLIDNSGNFGVNINPNNKLGVGGSVGIGAGFNVAGPTNGLIVEGKAGFGTTGPQTQLDVNGDAQFGSGATKSTFSATGALTFPAGYAPTSAQQAATKAYVDAPTGLLGSSSTWTGQNRYTNELTVSSDVVLTGQLGVGTLSPAAKLHVAGTADQIQLQVRGNSSQSGNIIEFGGSVAGQRFLQLDAAGHTTLKPVVGTVPALEVRQGDAATSGDVAQITDNTGSTKYLTVDGAGRVGVGPTAPSYALSVSTIAGYAGTVVSVSTGSSVMAQILGTGEIIAAKFTGDGSQLTGVTDAAAVRRGGDFMTGQLTLAGSTLTVLSNGVSPLSVSTSATPSSPALYVDAAGRVGVGTSSPGATLHVHGEAASIRLRNASSSTDWEWRTNVNASGFMTLMEGANQRLQLGGGKMLMGDNASLLNFPSARFITAGDASTPALLVASGTASSQEVLRVDTAGRLGLMTTAPAYRLDVQGDVRSTGTIIAAQFQGSGAGLSGVTDSGAVRKTGDSMSGQLTMQGSTLTVQGSEFSVGASTFVVTQGKIGVGIVVPGARIHAYGAGNQSVRLESSDSFGSQLQLMAVTSNGRTESQIQFRDRLNFVAPIAGSFVSAMREYGALGVGTIDPAARLHVSSANATSADTLLLVSSGTAAGQELLSVKGDGSMTLAGALTAGSVAGVVAKAGDFMTGQLTTESTITVKGSAFSVGGTTLTVQAGILGVRSGTVTSTPPQTNNLTLQYDSVNGQGRIGTYSTTGQTFLTLGTNAGGQPMAEGLRLDSQQKVGIGLAGSAASARLHVSSANAVATDTVFIVSSGPASSQQLLSVMGDGRVRYADGSFQTTAFVPTNSVARSGDFMTGQLTLQTSSLTVTGGRALVTGFGSVGTEANPTRVDIAGSDTTTAGDAKLVLSQGPFGSDLVLHVAGTDTRTDGLTANDQYITAAQRLNLRAKGNGTTSSAEVDIGVNGPTSSYGDVTISAAPPSVAAIERVRVQANGYVGIGTGMGAAARLHVSSANAVAADSILIVSSGTNNGQQLLSVKGDGKVGIGAGGSPSARLDVRLAPNEVAKFNDDFSASAVWGMNLGMIGQNSEGQLAATGSMPIVFYTGGTRNTMSAGAEKMRLTFGGDLGVGTASPQARLDVEGSAQFGAGATKSTFTATGDLQLAGALTSSSFSVTGNYFSVGGSTLVVSAGRVGIGTGSPLRALSVNGTMEATGGRFGELTNTTNSRSLTAYYDNSYGNGTDGAGVLQPVRLGVGYTPLVLMPQGGAVGINRTDPTAKLEIVGDAGLPALSVSTASNAGAETLRSGPDGALRVGPPSGGYAQGSGVQIVQPGIATLRMENTAAAKNFELQVKSDGVHFGGINGGQPFMFDVEGSETVRMLGDGRVGVGVATPEARLESRYVFPAVNSNATNYWTALQGTQRTNAIAAGVTDSGYRVGLRSESYFDTASFAGTLNEQYGLWSRVGTNAGATGTINKSYAAYLETLTNGATITDKWGVYQAGTGTKNYFEGKVGVGRTDPAELLHLYKPTAGSAPARLKVQTANADSFFVTEFGFAGGKSSVMIGQNRYWDDSGNDQRADTSNPAWSINMATQQDEIQFVHVDAAGAKLFPFKIDGPTGNVGVGTTSIGARLDVKSDQTAEGTLVARFTDATPTPMVEIYNSADGTAENAANAVLKVKRANSTGRSINAAGTINASGADYAEWIPWTGAKPAPGSIVQYKGTALVVSSTQTAAFVGNDRFKAEEAILIAFAGQLPVRVRGAVHEGDYIVPDADGAGRAVPAAAVTFGDYRRAVGVAWETSEGEGVRPIRVAVGLK